MSAFFEAWKRALDSDIIMELDEDLFQQELQLQPHEEIFLELCLALATLGLLYVSVLLHASLLFFCLARCRGKLQTWRRIVYHKTQRLAGASLQERNHLLME
jgi:hypothetical protein